MKNLFFLLILLSTLKLTAQQSVDSSFVMIGYVVDEDSIPVENANIIVFSSLKVYHSNAEGRFAFPILPSDSMMINHGNFERKVIHPPTEISQNNGYYFIEHVMNEIQQVDVNSARLMQKFNKNMSEMKDQMKNTQIPIEYSHGNGVVNQYSPKANNSNFGANVFELYKFIKQKTK